MQFFQINILVLLEKVCKTDKVAWNPRCWLLRYKCCIYIFSKRLSSKICQIQISVRFQFFLHLKTDGKGPGKNVLTFRHIFDYMVNWFVFHYIWQWWLIAYKNYSNFFKRKCKNQYYVYCDYNDISMIYINSNIALLRVRYH